MSKSDFDKNGVDKSGTHWLQYAALAVSAFAVYIQLGLITMMLVSIPL